MEPSAAPRQSSQGRGGSATSPIGLHGAGSAKSRRQLRAAARHRHSASAWLGLGYHKLLTRAQRVCSARWAVTAEKPLFIDKRLGLSARETQVPYLRSSDRVASPGIAQQKIKQGVGRPAEFLPPRQHLKGVVSCLRFLHRKIYPFVRGVCLKIERLRRRRLFFAPQAKFFGPERWGARNSRFSWHSNRNYLSKGLNVLG